MHSSDEDEEFEMNSEDYHIYGTMKASNKRKYAWENYIDDQEEILDKTFNRSDRSTEIQSFHSSDVDDEDIELNLPGAEFEEIDQEEIGRVVNQPDWNEEIEDYEQYERRNEAYNRIHRDPFILNPAISKYVAAKAWGRVDKAMDNIFQSNAELALTVTYLQDTWFGTLLGYEPVYHYICLDTNLTNVQCVNNVLQGVEDPTTGYPNIGSMSARIGNKITNKSIEMKLSVIQQLLEVAYPYQVNARLVLVYDRQTSEGYPLWTDVFGNYCQDGTNFVDGYNNLYSMQNIDTRDRFTVLYDKKFVIPPNSTLNDGTSTNTNVAPCDLEIFTIDEEVDCYDLETVFCGNSVGSSITFPAPCPQIKNIMTGGIYVMTMSDLSLEDYVPIFVTEPWYIQGTIRINFHDN